MCVEGCGGGGGGIVCFENRHTLFCVVFYFLCFTNVTIVEELSLFDFANAHDVGELSVLS